MAWICSRRDFIGCSGAPRAAGRGLSSFHHSPLTTHSSLSTLSPYQQQRRHNRYYLLAPPARRRRQSNRERRARLWTSGKTGESGERRFSASLSLAEVL